eukprot:c4480_g1_i3.p1 GENE.c4480_g1_i3~~c4480_g1_i3.p1  ORF type:complete len:322 (+),score=80.66 c4480_g1_i3:3-968(+)
MGALDCSMKAAQPRKPRRARNSQRRNAHTSAPSAGTNNRTSSTPKPHTAQQSHHNSSGAGGGASSGGGIKMLLDNPVFKSVLMAAAGTAAAKFTSSLGSSGGDKTPNGDPGKFDLYLLAMSWAPRFCCTNQGKCKKEKMSETNGLSTHGLWPAYLKPNASGRTYPAFCTECEGEERSREGHEWSKHGTCTGLNRDRYFEEETDVTQDDVIAEAEEILVQHSGDSVEIDKVAASLGGLNKVAFMSDNQCRLQEITMCWEKLPDGSVGDQVDCPDHVLGSSRNSAVLNGCRRLWLDKVVSDVKCIECDVQFSTFLFVLFLNVL